MINKCLIISVLIPLSCMAMDMPKTLSRAATLASALPFVDMTLAGHADKINAVALSDDGRLALTGSDDSTARLWLLDGSNNMSYLLVGHKKRVSTVAFSKDGRYAATGSDDGTVMLYNIQKLPPAWEKTLNANGIVTSISFSSDNRHLLVSAKGAKNQESQVWDLANLQKNPRFLSNGSSVQTNAFSPNGLYAVTGDKIKAKVWYVANFSNPKAVNPWLVHMEPIQSVSFTADSQYLLTCSQTKCFLLNMKDINSNPMQKAQVLQPGTNNYFFQAIISPDGRFVLASTRQGPWLWDLRFSPPKIYALPGHSKAVTSLVFCPSGCHALTGSEDGTIRLWDLSSMPPTSKVLNGDTGKITAATFCPGGCHILGGSSTGTAWLWKIPANPKP